MEKSEFELARKVAPAGPVFAKLVGERRTESELVGLFGEQREQARRKAFERNCRRPHSFVKANTSAWSGSRVKLF